MDEIMKDFTVDVANFLYRWKSDQARRDNKMGASLSYVLDHLRCKGWKIGGVWDLECRLEAAGFAVVPTRLKDGRDHKSNRCATFKGGN